MVVPRHLLPPLASVVVPFLFLGIPAVQCAVVNPPPVGGSQQQQRLLFPNGPFVRAQIVHIAEEEGADESGSSTTRPGGHSPNTTSAPATLAQSHPLLAVLIALLVCVLILATVLGNLMVCVAIALVRKLKAQPANLLLISLAVADFCVGLFVMPMAAVYLLQDRWPFGQALCRFWVTADVTLCAASILNLCMISVDRHLAVTRALRYSAVRTRRRICAYICVVWVGALLVSAAPLALLPFPDDKVHCQVSQNRFYQIYATAISFWGPSLIMVIVYFKLWSAAKRMQRQDRMVLRWQGLEAGRQSGESSQAEATTAHGSNGHLPASPVATVVNQKNSIVRANARFLFALRHTARKYRNEQQQQREKNNNTHGANGSALSKDGGKASLPPVRIPLITSHQKPHHQHEDKARKTLGVIMSVFIICWMPFFILALLKSQKLIGAVPHWLDSLALWLGYSNSMLNPLIYCKYNREFRIPFGEMLCCRFRTIQDVMRNESYYVKFGSPRSRPSQLSAATIRNGQPAAVRTERSYTHNDITRDENGNCLSVDVRAEKRNNSSPCVLSD